MLTIATFILICRIAFLLGIGVFLLVKNPVIKTIGQYTGGVTAFLLAILFIFFGA